MSVLDAVSGWRCRVCGALVDVGRVASWRCPNYRAGDRRHVLDLVTPGLPAASSAFSAHSPLANDENAAENEPVENAVDNELVGRSPFLVYRQRLAVDAFAATRGMTATARQAVIVETDGLIAAVTGTGFRITPLERNAGLSDALGFSNRGGVWVKDETRQVAGSHKARHLMTILLHLRVAETLGVSKDRTSPLAISSCGNAAIAAATLASAVSWPIQVFVPPSASAAVLGRLEALGAAVVACPRRADDPPGDPCVHRFREAVEAGAIPFGVQGPENAWCLDGGRTIGWEIADQIAACDIAPSRLYVQVGGGALATCVAAGLREAGTAPRFHAVQTAGCAPLARAWDRLDGHRGEAPDRWAQAMWPWEAEPHSLADGILDDETYDWLGIVEEMTRTGGSPVVASEAEVIEAASLVTRVSGIDASPTGASGLAGVIAQRAQIGDDEQLVVILSGIRR